MNKTARRYSQADIDALRDMYASGVPMTELARLTGQGISVRKETRYYDRSTGRPCHRVHVGPNTGWISKVIRGHVWPGHYDNTLSALRMGPDGLLYRDPFTR